MILYRVSQIEIKTNHQNFWMTHDEAAIYVSGTIHDNATNGKRFLRGEVLWGEVSPLGQGGVTLWSSIVKTP